MSSVPSQERVGFEGGDFLLEEAAEAVGRATARFVAKTLVEQGR
jgi:hypothetical protein